MKIYITNAGLGYNQYAYLVKVKQVSKEWANYLCIHHNLNDEDNSYEIGSIVLDLHNIYVEEVDEKIEKFEFCNSFLFKFFSENFKIDE